MPPLPEVFPLEPLVRGTVFCSPKPKIQVRRQKIMKEIKSKNCFQKAVVDSLPAVEKVVVEESFASPSLVHKTRARATPNRRTPGQKSSEKEQVVAEKENEVVAAVSQEQEQEQEQQQQQEPVMVEKHPPANEQVQQVQEVASSQSFFYWAFEILSAPLRLLGRSIGAMAGQTQ
jgi:hypothetical protein